MNEFSKEIYNVLTLGDKILIFILVLSGFFSFFLVKLFTYPGNFALISIQGEQKFRKNLNEDGMFILKGPIGDTKAEVSHGAIRVVDSDCPQKLCVHQGEIKYVGEIIVCVPNKITIWIQGRSRNKFDAITG